MNKRKAIIGGAAALTLLVAGVPVFAATTGTGTRGHNPPGIIGVVTTVTGNTITVKSRQGTTYTIDASNATVQKGFGKNAVAVAVTSIAVNDHVLIKGTVSGTTVSAQKVIDGARPGTFAAFTGTHRLAQAAFGTVQSMNGATITLSHKTKDGVQNLTVTTTASTVYKQRGATTTASSIAVGDHMVAMGTKDSNGNITNATTVRIFAKK